MPRHGVGSQKVERALFVGRFQPVHWGHVKAIKWALGLVDELVVVVGSAQHSHSLENPFTAGERIEMLRLALRYEGLDLSRVIIIPVPDVNANPLWVRLVEVMSPPFDLVVTGNPLVARLFADRGYKVLKPPFFDRERLTATNVRRLMIEGGNWKDLVPPPVAEYIEHIGGIERLREVIQHDR